VEGFNVAEHLSGGGQRMPLLLTSLLFRVQTPEEGERFHRA
jgi:hypothetical protein